MLKKYRQILLFPIGGHIIMNVIVYNDFVFFNNQVFTLLTIQILITFTAVCVCTFSDTVKTMVQEHEWVHKSSYIAFGAVDAFLATFYKYIRIFPLNLLGLVSFIETRWDLKLLGCILL